MKSTEELIEQRRGARGQRGKQGDPGPMGPPGPPGDTKLLLFALTRIMERLDDLENAIRSQSTES